VSAAPADGIARLAERLRQLTGWRRALAAALLGLAAAAALPPLYVLPLLIVAMSGLVCLLDTPARDARHGLWIAFADGWWFGFAHFAGAFYWLANALLLDAGDLAWLMPILVVALSAGLALFPAIALAATRASGARGLAGALILAVAWTAVEWLRGHILTGFPWNLIGTVWAASPSMMQGVALFGIYGLSLLTVIAVALPATLAAREASTARRWSGPVIAAAMVLAGWSAGAVRLSTGADADVPGVALRLVQPNVPQSLKWDPAQRDANLRKAMDMTRGPGFETRTHVIWPETAVPFAITDVNRDGPAFRTALATMAPPSGLLITGAPRADRDADGRLRIWNSLHALDTGAAIVATYDKHHLVPFGEYVPLRPLIGFAFPIAGAVDFSAGPGPATIDLAGLPPASPLICYEVIFPGRVVAAEHRPGWLLNVTNDAWFGHSSGPYQHFVTARFRAIEEGLPVIRVANNGISAVVDGHGRVRAALGLGETGVVDAALPQALAPTIYSRWGDLMVAGLALFLLLAARLVRTRTN
jgi:apolipoprotein N-acyltransferase